MENTYSETKCYKMVVLGGGGVGKSSLTIRLLTDNFLDEYEPTIEDSYRKIVMVDKVPAMLDILDTAGQEEFNAMRDQWMREGKGFLLVYNITRKNTFIEVQMLKDKLEQCKDTKIQNIPIVIAGNKCDLTQHREVETSEAKALAKEWNCAFMETSAKDKINNSEIFYQLVREINRQSEASKDSGKGKQGKKLKCQIL